MRKIHHGLIAIAILGGPASIILVHQKLTKTVPREASSPVDVAIIAQQAYSRCSEAPQPGRPSQCDEYIRSFDRCAARKNDCDPRSVYEILLKSNIAPSDRGTERSPKPL
jgi:hypothetical protein